MSMKLEEAKGTDHEAVVELVNIAYRGAGQTTEEEAGWTCERGLLTGLRLTQASLDNDLRNKPEAHLLVYRESADGPLLGTVWLEPRDKSTWYLGLLTVRPDLQDRQLGRGLLAEAEAFAKARGAKRMHMTVLNVRDTLIAWYERRGYRRTGETEPFPYEDERFGKALRDDLGFVRMHREL